MTKKAWGALEKGLSGLLVLAVALPGRVVAEDLVSRELATPAAPVVGQPMADDAAGAGPSFLELDELPTVFAAPVAAVALVGGIAGSTIGIVLDTTVLAAGTAYYTTVTPVAFVASETLGMVQEGVIGVSPHASEWGVFSWPRPRLFLFSPIFARVGERLGQIVTVPYGGAVLGIDDVVAHVRSAF